MRFKVISGFPSTPMLREDQVHVSPHQVPMHECATEKEGFQKSDESSGCDQEEGLRYS